MGTPSLDVTLYELKTCGHESSITNQPSFPYLFYLCYSLLSCSIIQNMEKKEKFFFIILPLSRGHRDLLYFVTLNGIWTMILSSYGFLFLWWINSMTKSKLWRTGTFWLILSHCSQSFKEVRIETQIWQECGGRSSCRGHGEVLFNDLLLMPYSACFLIECKTTSPGLVPSNLQCAGPSLIYL